MLGIRLSGRAYVWEHMRNYRTLMWFEDTWRRGGSFFCPH